VDSPQPIRVAQWGQFLATRASGRAARAHVLAEAPDGLCVLDFSGVEAVTVAFADELVANLAAAGRPVLITGAYGDVWHAIERAVTRRTGLAEVTVRG